MAQRSGTPTWLIALFAVVGLVVVVLAVLGVLAWAGVRKYISASKQAEAVNTVGEIARDGAAAYSREALATLAPAHKLCESASSPVPASIVAVKGKKYMSTPAEWHADEPVDKGFACLKFEMSLPQYYQYDYKLDSPVSFTAIAHGDLDADGVTSEFTQHGTVRGAEVQLDPIVKRNPDE